MLRNLYFLVATRDDGTPRHLRNRQNRPQIIKWTIIMVLHLDKLTRAKQIDSTQSIWQRILALNKWLGQENKTHQVLCITNQSIYPRSNFNYWKKGSRVKRRLLGLMDQAPYQGRSTKICYDYTIDWLLFMKVITYTRQLIIFKPSILKLKMERPSSSSKQTS